MVKQMSDIGGKEEDKVIVIKIRMINRFVG